MSPVQSPSNALILLRSWFELPYGRSIGVCGGEKQTSYLLDQSGASLLASAYRWKNQIIFNHALPPTRIEEYLQ